jgi:hypothetical protein
MDRTPYTPSTRSRIIAFFFTDRVGQTLAATLGLAGVARWWAGNRLRRRRAETR